MKNFTKFFFVFILFISLTDVNAQGSSCASSDPFCTGSPATFPAGTNVTDAMVAEPGNNYGCLGSAPNPAWYFMEIASSGSFTIDITNSNGVDIDFITYGPYTSLADALSNCGTLGSGADAGSIVDCSYDPQANEVATFPSGVVAGEVYLLLITNYGNSPTNVTFNETGSSSGTTNCNIVNPCDITSLSANPGACNPATNTYNVTGTLNFVNPPASGTITVTSSCGGSATLNPPFNSPMNYTITGVTATGGACTVTASFTADPACSITQNYTSPAPCNPSCLITNFTANISACNPATTTYTVNGQVTFTSPPATGTMTIQTCGGNSQVFNAPFVSPINYNITGIPADGTANCNVTVSFSANGACTSTVGPFTEPTCPCNMDNMFVNINSCDPATGTYSVTVDLDFTSPPASGTLQVNVCGSIQNIPMPATSPQTLTFTGLNPNGGACVVDAFFTADPTCGNSLNYTAPTGCDCTVDIGTFSDNIVGSAQTDFLLCWNDVLNITSNNDNTDPDLSLNNPGINYDPGMWLLVYTCPPTVFAPNDLVDATGNWVDPCCLGIFDVTDGNWSILNNLGDGSTYYFVPLTMYSMSDGYYSATDFVGACYELGPPYEVTFLPEVTAVGVENCPTGTVTVTVNGGDPAINGGSFTASNLLPATATFSNTTATNGGDIVISGLQNGDMYSFDIADANGCPVTFTGGPFVGPPATNINAAGPFCLTDPAVNLTVVPATAGTWSGTGITNTATGTFNPTTAGLGTHTITFTPTGCFLPSTENIVVNDVYDATITPDGPFCETDANVFLVAADPGGTWSGTGIIDANTGEFSPAAATIGNNVITYNIPGACGDNDTETIVIIANSDATITPAGPFCSSDPAVNLVGADPGGTWSGTGITNATTGAFDPATAGLGTHTITYTIAGQCGDIGTINITVNDVFDATINPAGPFCESNANTFLAAADPGGTWAGPGIINAATGEFSPVSAGAGTHNITYTIAGACGDTDNINIQVIADADATITPAGPFCITDAAVNLVGAQTGGTWAGQGITSAANGTFNPATAGAGTWPITYTISGVCGDIGNLNITVIDLIPSDITQVGPFCVDDASVTLVGASPGGTWSGNGITDAANGTFDPAVAGPGTHTITYTISGSCGTTSSIDIVVNPLPVPVFVADVVSGCAPLTVTFTDNTIPAGTLCLWSISNGVNSNNCGTFTTTFDTPGTYSVTLTLTSAEGCVGTTTVTNMITVYPNPIADFSFGPDDADITNPVINFTNESTGATIYNWDFAGLGSSSQTHPSFIFPNDNPGTYTVCLEASTVNGCIDSICKTIIIHDVFVIYVPNAFTPDNDGINDVFLPILSGIDPLSYDLMIFNRWGELIFETNNYGSSWDGTHKGLMSQEDVYVWKIKVKDAIRGEKHEYIGHVTLLK